MDTDSSEAVEAESEEALDPLDDDSISTAQFWSICKSKIRRWPSADTRASTFLPWLHRSPQEIATMWPKLFCFFHGSSLRSLNIDKLPTQEQKSSFYQKNHILKLSIFPKFTISNFHFWQNSHFQNLIFHKIHVFKISILTKFIFLK